jgi:hypothetical protein
MSSNNLFNDKKEEKEEKEEKLPPTIPWPQVHCHECGNTFRFDERSLCCHQCKDEKDELNQYVNMADNRNNTSTISRCIKCKNDYLSSDLPGENYGPHCYKCSHFYCQLPDCFDPRSRCYCGFHTMSDHCDLHRESGQETNNVIEYDYCNICARDVCQFGDCVNKIVEKFDYHYNRVKARCKQCCATYTETYCQEHQHLEPHYNCEKMFSYVSTHCAWCNAVLTSATAPVITTSSAPEQLISSSLTLTQPAQQTSISTMPAQQVQQCMTDGKICRSIQHLSSNAVALCRDNQPDTLYELSCLVKRTQKRKKINAIFCQGCAEFCLFQKNNNDYQCISCLLYTDEENELGRKKKLSATIGPSRYYRHSIKLIFREKLLKLFLVIVCLSILFLSNLDK